jgi:hypothetical protein
VVVVSGGGHCGGLQGQQQLTPAVIKHGRLDLCRSMLLLPQRGQNSYSYTSTMCVLLPQSCHIPMMMRSQAMVGCCSPAD